MKTRTSLIVLLFAGCSSQPGVTPDASQSVDAVPGDAVPADASTSVTFTYTPAWDGVQSVSVIGGFGQADDWTQPLLTLTPTGGVFTGTAMLPAGQYLYVFHVVGDAAAGTKATTFSRYAIDPASANFQPCPAQSPTFDQNAPNPCGQLSVPQTAGTTYHVRGTVVMNAAPAASYLVVLEREEAASHHFFVNRVTTGTDGTYDLSAAPGKYRVQVLNPSFESMTDAQLVPGSTLRREISSAFAVAADVSVSSAEVAFHDYASFAPKTTATLPTTFTFGTASGLPTRLEVYGTGMTGASPEIGDPWFSSPPTMTGTASFAGMFTTAQAHETAVALGERYFWGVEQTHPADLAGVSWVGQSMVYPVTWH